MARPRLLTRGRRTIDAALLLLLFGGALQLVPLPVELTRMISPHVRTVHRALGFPGAPLPSVESLSIDPGATLFSLAYVAAIVLVFWSCRELFSTEGGSRDIARLVAWMGLLLGLLTIVQRTTQPGMLYWLWKPLDRGASPFGPFVNRNHFATWMLAATPVATGYLVAHAKSRRDSSLTRDFLARLGRLVDATTVRMLCAIWVMVLMVVLSLSRSGLIGLIGGLVVAMAGMSRRLSRDEIRWLTTFACLLVGGILLYANMNAVVLRFESLIDGGSENRAVIWRETLPIIRDFQLMGAGLGAFPTAMLAYQQSDRSIFFNQAHNQYLQLAAEGGLLLVVPAAAAALAFIVRVVRLLARDPSAMYFVRTGAAAAVFGVCVQGMWETGLRMPANAVLCAVAAAMAVHESRHRLSSAG